MRLNNAFRKAARPFVVFIDATKNGKTFTRWHRFSTEREADYFAGFSRLKGKDAKRM